MLNLNYNIIGTSYYDRFSKEEAKGFIPFQIQYLVVGGGGGAAAGDTTTLGGQAGSGGAVVTGSYCVIPFSTYNITVGQGGLGGASITSTFPDFTGSNGGTSSFDAYVAFGGPGGTIQTDLSSSLLQGNGAGASGSNGNGGSGSLWTYNGPNSPAIGEWSSSLLWGGGGAGYNVPTLFVEYLALAGGGAGGGRFNSGTVYAGGGGGGGVVTGSYAITSSVSSFNIIVGTGGITGSGVTSDGGNGNPSNIFGFQATGGNGGRHGSAPGVGGSSGAGSLPANPGDSGGGGAGSAGSGLDGGNGLQWVDGNRYGRGGYAAYTAGGGSIFIGVNGVGITSGSGGVGSVNGATNAATNGTDGIAIIRYPGSGSKGIGGVISYSGGYTYHTFLSSSTFQATILPTTGSSGLPGPSGGGVARGTYPFNTGSFNGTMFTGGGAGASFYGFTGSKGGDGLVALRYEGLPIAEGGQVVITNKYTYHIYTASGQFYAIGQETNPNINPCP